MAAVPTVADAPTDTNTDPTLASSLVWTVDEDYLGVEAYPDLEGAVLLTTRQAGSTTVNVSGTTLSGLPIAGSGTVVIAQALVEEWKEGDQRYEHGSPIDWTTPLTSGDPAHSIDGCGLSASEIDDVPKTTACASCHNDTSGITAELTPAQTAGFSDDDLIQMFSIGMHSSWMPYTSELLRLRTTRQADCVYATFHSTQLADAAKPGLVWKLRSLEPKN